MHPLPTHAIEMLNILRNAGFEAYAVGGCVRDALLGFEPTDVDITTSAPSDAILRLFPASVQTGGKFMTVTVINAGGKAEITPFRSDGGYSDSRRPDKVSLASGLYEDLSRRDFTINTLCFDGENIIDLLDGSSDLYAGIIRCVGEPRQRFGEDALRIMRAFRFSAELGFTIEQQTLDAALSLSPNLKNISVERIRDELTKALLSRSPERITPLLESNALVFLGIAPSPVPDKLGLLSCNPTARLSAFFYTCGRDAVESFKVPTRLKRDIQRVCAALDRLPEPDIIAIKREMSRFSAEVFAIAAEIAETILQKPYEYVKLCRDIVLSGEPYRISDLAVNGDDLKAAGIQENQIGSVLSALLDAVIESPQLNTVKDLNIIIGRLID